MANSAQLRNEIAAGKWDDKLRALYGDAAQEICRQRARYCAALEQFELYFGPGRQVQVYSAPGRAPARLWPCGGCHAGSCGRGCA